MKYMPYRQVPILQQRGFTAYWYRQDIKAAYRPIWNSPLFYGNYLGRGYTWKKS
jgi:hypothetical protein